MVIRLRRDYMISQINGYLREKLLDNVADSELNATPEVLEFLKEQATEHLKGFLFDVDPGSIRCELDGDTIRVHWTYAPDVIKIHYNVTTGEQVDEHYDGSD